MTKEREELTKDNPIKFNRGSIIMKGNSLALTQEQHCQNLKIVSSEAENLTSSRGVTRKMISPKEQYIAQRARGAYIATVCQPEAAFDLLLAAQVTDPTEEDVRKLNKRLLWQKNNLSRGLNFISLKVLGFLTIHNKLYDYKPYNHNHMAIYGYVWPYDNKFASGHNTNSQFSYLSFYRF